MGFQAVTSIDVDLWESATCGRLLSQELAYAIPNSRVSERPFLKQATTSCCQCRMPRHRRQTVTYYYLRSRAALNTELWIQWAGGLVGLDGEPGVVVFARSESITRIYYRLSIYLPSAQGSLSPGMGSQSSMSYRRNNVRRSASVAGRRCAARWAAGTLYSTRVFICRIST